MKDLPPFSVRESPKAKRVVLKFSARHGLEVVIPQGFNRKKVTQIVREKREWIERTFRKIQQAGGIPDQPRELPDTIYFEAVNLGFAVEYVSLSSLLLELVQLNLSSLRISGDTSDQEGCRGLLKRWLQHQGRVHLIPWLEQVSSQTGLTCRKIQIRGQKSHWGSCSSQGTISLNYNLLFLRPEVVRYLMLHELCHTVHLNHSAKFYQLLEELVPDFQALRTELKQAWNRLPWWTI